MMDCCRGYAGHFNIFTITQTRLVVFRGNLNNCAYATYPYGPVEEGLYDMAAKECLRF